METQTRMYMRLLKITIHWAHVVCSRTRYTWFHERHSVGYVHTADSREWQRGASPSFVILTVYLTEILVGACLYIFFY